MYTDMFLLVGLYASLRNPFLCIDILTYLPLSQPDGPMFIVECLTLYGCGFEGCSSQDVPVALQCLEEMLKKRRKQVQR